MNWKNILVSGTCTGALLAAFTIVVFILAEMAPRSLAGQCGGVFLLALVSVSIVNQISKRAGWPDMGLKILLPIGFLTSIQPISGGLIFIPNSGITSMIILLFLGVLGGAFWSLPFAGWNYLKSRD